MINKKLIIANWKMAPATFAEAKKIFSAIKKTAGAKKNVQTVVCPPFVYTRELANMVSGHRCVVGTQDLFWEKSGSYTGEISADMLKDAKAKYVIIGHSERRALGETNDVVGKKVSAALRAGFRTVLCIGEPERDEHGGYIKFLIEELHAALGSVNRPMLSSLVIAYEPIWAIGKKGSEAAGPEDVLEISILIKKVLADMFDKNNVMDIPILYGGSVDHTNAQMFFDSGGVQGLLVGRASRDPKKFEKILKIANEI